MKRGFEYGSSREKRAFDVTVASLFLPGVRAGELVIKRLLAQSAVPDLEPIFVQERVGLEHQRFEIQKYQTLLPGTHEPIAGWAGAMRRLGLDEIAQLYNIRKGEMSFTGPRPLITEEYEQVRGSLSPKRGSAWDKVLDVFKPGLYNSYGIYSHCMEPGDPNEPDIRAEMDIMDATNASVAHDIALTAEFIGVAVGRRLK